MPKGKLRGKAANHKVKISCAELPGGINSSRWEASSESSNLDNASIISIASDSICDDGGTVYDNQEVDEQSSKEDLESRVSEAIDGCTQKSAKGRQTCLDDVRKDLGSQSLLEFVSQRRVTIADAIERSLKKGKTAEQASAAKLASVLAITLGSYGDDVEDMMSTLRPILQIILNDNSMGTAVRSECASALGLCSFISSGEAEALKTTMDLLHNTFSSSFLKGNKVAPTYTSDATMLHSCALQSWCLLLGLLPYSTIYKMAETPTISRVPELLQSPDVELRIAAGETIAVIHEMARNCNENYEMENSYELCETLRLLATDSNKYRAKKDRRQQRSSFRDILRAVQEDDYPDIQVKFGQELLIVDSWCKKRQYDAFCSALGPGMNRHLAENELLRDVFELGTPLTPMTAAENKISKNERHLVNVAAFKARTKARNKSRDKRSAVF